MSQSLKGSVAGPLSERFQILSLDGGGIKGILAAALLAGIEQDTGLTITDHFDLIVGTSTGGIIALGLGLGMRPREILEFYLTEGPKIFPRGGALRSLGRLLRPKFDSQDLAGALQRCFKRASFGDSKTRLVIASYNLGADDIYLFRTPHHERLRRDYKVPAWQVALATSAAPTFFQAFRALDHLRLIDGGVWANNPSVVGIVEAFGTLGVPLSAMKLLSVGTSDPVVGRPSRLNRGGLVAWALGNAAVDVILRGQSIGATNQANYFLGPERVERINPAVAADEFSLDGIHKVEDLIGKASHHSRRFLPAFRAQFAEHRAHPYQPLYALTSEGSDD